VVFSDSEKFGAAAQHWADALIVHSGKEVRHSRKFGDPQRARTFDAVHTVTVSLVIELATIL